MFSYRSVVINKFYKSKRLTNTLHLFSKKEKSTMESKNVTAEQKYLLNSLVDKDEELKSTKFMVGGFTSRWELITEQLNTLKGPKKTATEWWLAYQLEKKHHTGSNEYVAKMKIEPDLQPTPSTSSTELGTATPTHSEQTLNTLAAALHDMSTKDISKLKETIMLKIYLLLGVDDHTNCLNAACRMTITDWLLFDTQLVHENFDVIQKNRIYETDHKPLKDLFHLVAKYNTEYLQGDELANAWTALTIEYNSRDRHCTPMLLQRRWYQLKLATRQSIYKFRYIYLRSPYDVNLLMNCKLTPLQRNILCQFTKVAVEKFMSWEEQIKNGLVILREQFVSIAMKNMCAQTPSIQIVPGPPARIDITSTVEKVCDVTPQKLIPISIASDVSMSCRTQEHTSQITETNDECKVKSDPEIDIDSTLTEECNELNIEMPSPLNEVTGSDDQKPVLPLITNVFGNAHVPIETLSKISALARKMTESDVENGKHNNASLNEQSNENNEGLEIDLTEEIDDGKQLGSTAGEKKKEVPTIDKKLLMNAVVNTVKLDHMGVLPMRLLRRVKNKKIIEIINAKSKVPKNVGSKLKYKTNNRSNKVELSNSRITKFGKYSYSELIKNPDFNISLKKLNRKFFSSYRNRMLLRACKPLSIDLDKSFESKLKNGKMILKPSAFCQNGAADEQVTPIASQTNVSLKSSDAETRSKLTNEKNVLKPFAFCQNGAADEQVTPNASQANISLQSSDAETRTRNINTKLAFIPIAPKVNLSLPRIPDALPIISTPKFITVIPLTTKVSTDTESLLVNDSTNDTRLIDLYTLNKMLCLVAHFERQQAVQNDINATDKQNIVADKGNNEVQDISEPTVAKSSTISEPEKKNLSSHRFKPCCWAQAKWWSITNGRRVVEEHKCNFPSCQCCCKKILASLYTYKRQRKKTCIKFISRNSPLSNSELLKADVRQKTIYSKEPNEKLNTKNKFNKLDDRLADAATTFTDQPVDKYLSLGKNKMLLTTTKFPKNFNLFTRFQHYIDNNLTVPKAIRLVLKPSGRVFLKCKDRAQVDPKILKEILYLISEFNRLSSVTTAQRDKKNNDVTPNTAFNKESSCMEDTEDNSIAVHNKETLESVVTEQLIINPISGNTTTTILPAEIKQEPDLQPDKENTTVIDKIKSCLGTLVCKTLTPIKLVSEIQYAYLQNGLFFKLDIDTGALMPINVCVKKNRTPIQDCNSGSINSLSASRKTKPPIPIKSKTLSSLTHNDPESMSSQSPISILSTSPEPISSSLPGEISSKPVESTVSELSISVDNGICDVPNIPYLSNVQFDEKPLVKVEDTSTSSDDDNTESWNLFDKFLSIDDTRSTEESINLNQKESSNTPIDFDVDQKEKVKVEQILGL